MTGSVYLVSACLLGLATRYDGGHNLNEAVQLVFGSRSCIIPICPEQLGGLPTPRPPAEIAGGDGAAVIDGRAAVVTAAKKDVTASYLKGAEQALLIAQMFKADGAVLKARSPSCGSGKIHNGSFSSHYMDGDGVTAALLKRRGIPVFTEEDLDDLVRER